MYPTPNTVVVPKFGDAPRPITLDEVRKYGRLVAVSENNQTATAEVTIPDAATVSYCGVTLNEDGSVKDFIPRTTGTAKFSHTYTEEPKS